MTVPLLDIPWDSARRRPNRRKMTTYAIPFIRIDLWYIRRYGHNEVPVQFSIVATTQVLIVYIAGRDLGTRHEILALVRKSRQKSVI